MSEINKDKNDSLRAQLALLQTRIGLHGSRLWQFPFTYAGTLALVASFDRAKLISHPSYVFIYLAIVGVVILFCMRGASEGYRRAAEYLVKVENELGIHQATRAPRSHIVPYFVLQGFSVASATAAAIVFAC